MPQPAPPRLPHAVAGARAALLVAAMTAFPVAASETGDCGGPPPTLIDRAFERLYNFDFPNAYAHLDDHQRRYPACAVTHSVRAAALMFGELHRLGILETEFFRHDKKVTSTKLKADSQIRTRLFAETAAARRLGEARLAHHPADRDAMIALCMATGVETDYTILVEKRYFRSFTLSRQSQMYARKLLALEPPEYDAYLTLGAVEYVVGSLNFVFRLFARFDGIKGSKDEGAASLRKVVDHGRFYPPFARMLLAVIHLRAKQHDAALGLLRGLARDFPANPLFPKEVAHLESLLAKLQPAGGR